MMINIYGEKTYWYEILGPADDHGDCETIDFIDAYSKAHAEIMLRNAIRRGTYPRGSTVYRWTTSDKTAERAGHTQSHFDIIPMRKGA